MKQMQKFCSATKETLKSYESKFETLQNLNDSLSQQLDNLSSETSRLRTSPCPACGAVQKPPLEEQEEVHKAAKMVLGLGGRDVKDFDHTGKNDVVPRDRETRDIIDSGGRGAGGGNAGTRPGPRDGGGGGGGAGENESGNGGGPHSSGRSGGDGDGGYGGQWPPPSTAAHPSSGAHDSPASGGGPQLLSQFYPGPASSIPTPGQPHSRPSYSFPLASSPSTPTTTQASSPALAMDPSGAVAGERMEIVRWIWLDQEKKIGGVSCSPSGRPSCHNNSILQPPPLLQA
ncbi:hypothetical protein BT69DRAFT_1082269 [Atractiella rhizophila]|nr:hypothetical protein BT69DRAFT_1082269 [Atractiella rhizophila]